MKRVQAACAGALFGTLVVIGVACLVWTPAQVGQPTELRQFKVTIIPPRARGVYGQRYMIPGRPLVPAIAPNFANVRSRKSSSLRRLRRLLGSQNKGVRRLEKRVGRLARVMRKERSRAAARLRRITKLLKKRSKAAQKGAGEKQILQATLKKMMAAINAKVADLKAKLKKASIADNAKVNKARRQARIDPDGSANPADGVANPAGAAGDVPVAADLAEVAVRAPPHAAATADSENLAEVYSAVGWDGRFCRSGEGSARGCDGDGEHAQARAGGVCRHLSDEDACSTQDSEARAQEPQPPQQPASISLQESLEARSRPTLIRSRVEPALPWEVVGSYCALANAYVSSGASTVNVGKP
eukprot:CAMPEP_0114556770 /NCGR_PEP_ID=MMETSP0114-20121206/9465_1 /TAXON_ID=31324 /ORGANISM="Goniomonas sp, Strain m" /LENGTH=356 /DNA_ID=CAMNT_0001741995 /DNA_START=124 /DNA_END=1193 /DNA_ORIENTATION=-